MPQSLHESSPKLQYGGNTYSQLSSEQQSSIYQGLSKRCHPIDILRLERIILDDEPRNSSTARKPGLAIGDFVAAPKRYHSIERQKVVAISCEWGRGKNRQNELVAICAIDFLTGDTLVDSLVAPSQPMCDWRSRSHGISAAAVEAVAGGHKKCLQGWREARAKLFEYIDAQTILVGHTIRTDLGLLRLFHTRIVDSQVLATTAVFSTSRRKGYKWPIDKVCEGFLGITIRQNSTSSAFENVLASREIVLQCIRRPKDLEAWGRQARIEFCKPRDDGKDVKKAVKEGSPAASASKQTNAGHIPDDNELLVAYNDGYEAGYQAAYQAGFQSGFQTGYEKANSQGNPAWFKSAHHSGSRCDGQHNTQQLIQYIVEEETPGDQGESASHNASIHWSRTAEAGGVLARLAKDSTIKETAHRANQKENRPEKATRANEADDRETTNLQEDCAEDLLSPWSDGRGW
ncbi:hypothetical protein Trco_007998 [Trichoderma cornu-damae]|uniref:Exonuclease domain-containing protein n=1 Tax=Trichoderma cornu-damae TaxID=654480 RepID=A0A9P8QIA0_9HYPO|nr:hypothetical protein Trco_007998 [Trichoderma cornu-damae]